MKISKEKIFVIIALCIFASGLLIYCWNYLQGKDLRKSVDLKFQPVSKMWREAREKTQKQVNYIYAGRYFEQESEIETKDFILKVFKKYGEIDLSDIDLVGEDDFIAKIQYSNNLNVEKLQIDYGDVVMIKNVK